MPKKTKKKTATVVPKETYVSWEKEVLSLKVRKNTPRTSKAVATTIPKKDAPVSVLRQKVAIIVDFVGKDNVAMSEHTTQNTLAQLFPRTDIQLHHIGNRRGDAVKCGYDREKGMVSFPGTDCGGLMNYRQSVNTPCELSKSSYVIDPTRPVQNITTSVYKKWLALSHKDKFYGNMKRNVTSFITSVVDYIKQSDVFESAHLRFWTLPVEPKIIFTAKDIKRHTGTYYQRIYGKGDEKFAERVAPTKTMFCAVTTDKFITSNITKLNLQNEYRSPF
jgi:hypothetical protein